MRQLLEKGSQTLGDFENVIEEQSYLQDQISQLPLNSRVQFYVYLYLTAYDFDWKPRQMSASLSALLARFLELLILDKVILRRLNYLS